LLPLLLNQVGHQAIFELSLDHMHLSHSTYIIISRARCSNRAILHQMRCLQLQVFVYHGYCFSSLSFMYPRYLICVRIDKIGNTWQGRTVMVSNTSLLWNEINLNIFD
jgi:hypothetical protein